MTRKPHNMTKRMTSATGALLSQYGVCVVNIDPAARQGLMSWKSLKNVRHTPAMAAAVCDYAHAWVIYIGAMCIDNQGVRYLKGTEIQPVGRHRSDALSWVIEQHYRKLMSECNTAHIVGSGWIANPSGVSLSEAQAYGIFEAAGGWSAENVATEAA